MPERAISIFFFLSFRYNTNRIFSSLLQANERSEGQFSVKKKGIETQQKI